MDRQYIEQTRVPPRRSAARSAAWNYAGYAYQIVLNFGLTAYIVRHIAVAEYGLFVLVMSISATLNLLDLGISGVLVQRYVHAARRVGQAHVNDLMSTAFVVLAALGAVGVAILCVLAWLLPGPFRIPSHLVHEAALVFVIAGVMMQVRLPAVALRQAFQAYERFDRINQVSFVTSTVQAVLSVGALVAGFGVVGLALALLAGAVVQIAIFLVALPFAVPGSRLNVFRFDRSLLRSLVMDGKWAFVSNVTSYLVEIATWSILGSLGSMTVVALYGVALKAPNQLWNLADRGADVLLPALSGFWAEEDYAGLRKLFLTTQQLIFGAVLPFVVLGAIFAPPLLHLWVGRQYISATPAMRWLLMAALAHAIAYSSDLMLYASGRFKRAAWINVSGGALTCIGALFLVPGYGAAGMALSWAVSVLVIDCGWFTMEACRISRTSAPDLVQSLVSGLGIPVLVLAAATTAVLGLRPVLSPLWTVVAATAAGVLYFVFWGYRTALPLYRKRVEFAA